MATLRHTLLTGALLLASAWPAASDANELELRVRAAFLYNLAKFVEWPAQSLNDTHINICVLRGTDFEGVLRQEIEGKSVGTRVVAVMSVAPFENKSACQILHLEESLPRDDMQEILRTLADKPVLTVGHRPGFTRDGGILRLKRDQGRLRFEIALPSGREAGLNFSSKLLRVAELVDGAGA
jgi:hypothetical protein